MAQEKTANPAYPKTPFNPSCKDKELHNNDFYVPEGFENIKIYNIKSNSPEILVSKTIEGNKETFTLLLAAYKVPTISLSLEGYSNGVLKGNPVLLGEVIDRVDLSWVLNKEVESQILSNDGGILNPTLNAVLREYSYTDLNLTNDTEFTLQVNDGSNYEGSVVTNSKIITFGNYYYIDSGINMINQNISTLQTFLNNANKTIEKTKVNSFYATGLENEHEIIAYPKRFGLITEIKKGVFSGGYVRLKNASGILKETLSEGETESDINITNGLASEAYYVYMSFYDNQNDSNIPLIIS